MISFTLVQPWQYQTCVLIALTFIAGKQQRIDLGKPMHPQPMDKVWIQSSEHMTGRHECPCEVS